MFFRSSGIQESNSSNGVQIRVETKKLWPFEDDYTKLNGNVAAAPHFTTFGHVFGALNGAKIMHTISCFKYWEVRSPDLQTVLNLELKRRSYGYSKTTVQTMSWNVASAPPFRYCWTHFLSTSWSSNYAYHFSFRSLGIQESSVSNGVRFRFETKKLWPFEDEPCTAKAKFFWFRSRTPISKGVS